MILSFSITRKLAEKYGAPDPLLSGAKTVTRRLWADKTAAKYKAIYERGEIVKAFSNAVFVPEPHKGKHIADIILTASPYQERLGDMPQSDLLAEGGFWRTRDEFIFTVCNGKPNPDLVVWVCRFKLVRIVG